MSGTGEYGLPARIAAQVRGKFQHAIKVGVQRSILAGRGGAFEGLLDDIFGDNRLAPVRTILRRIGLKVETHRTLAFFVVGLKGCQFPDFVPRHHVQLLLRPEVRLQR